MTYALFGGGFSVPGSLPAFAITEVSPGYPLRELLRSEPGLFGGATLDTDARAVHQAGWLWAAQQQKPLAFMENGLSLINSPTPDTAWDDQGATGAARHVLLIENGMEVHYGPQTRIEGTTTGTPSFVGMVSARRNGGGRADPAQRPLFKIYGGNFGKAGTRSGVNYGGELSGHVFCVLGAAGSLMERVKIENYGAGRALNAAGDWRVERLELRYPTNAAGAGGLRLYFGTGFICRNSYGLSHDDLWQFAVDGVETSLWGAGSPVIDNCWFENCEGISTDSRLCIAAIPDDNRAPGAVTARILNSGFVNIHATGLVTNVLACRNEAGGERAIDNILFRNITGGQRDSNLNSDRDACDFFGGSALAGATGLVRLEDVTILAVNSRSIRARGKFGEVRIKNFRSDAVPRYPLIAGAVLSGMDRLVVEGFRTAAPNSASLDGLLIGGPDTQLLTGAASQHLGGDSQYPGDTVVRGGGGFASLDGIQVTDVWGGRYALAIGNLTRGVDLKGFSMAPRAGVTTAAAIQHAADGGTLSVDRSDFTGAGAAVPILLSGARRQYDFGRDNLALPATLRSLVRAAPKLHPGFRDGGIYPLAPGAASAVATTAVANLDTLMLSPIPLEELLLLEKLGFRVGTVAGTNGTGRVVLFRAGLNGLPTGLPFVGTNEFLTTTVAGDRLTAGDLAALVEEPFCWGGTVFHVSAPVCSHFTGAMAMARVVGAASGQAATTAPTIGYHAGIGALPSTTDILSVDLTSATLTPITATSGMPVPIALVNA